MNEEESNGKEYWRLRTESLQNDYQMRELLREEFKVALSEHERQCPAAHRNYWYDRAVTAIITGSITGLIVLLATHALDKTP